LQESTADIFGVVATLDHDDVGFLRRHRRGGKRRHGDYAQQQAAMPVISLKLNM
jgi:hypothetical protein